MEQQNQGGLFDLGDMLVTPAALSAMSQYGINGLELLMRHVHGDWGVVDSSDAKANDLAVKQGTRILSAYILDKSKPAIGDNKIWVLTEADRSSTCLMLPSEY